MPAPPTLVLFAKYPVPGYAKTRLIPALGPDGAAQVHRHLTERTVATLLKSGAPVEIRYAGAQAQAFADWLGNAPAYVEQVEGGLTERLIDAGRPAPHIYFGADTPELTADLVREALQALESHDVVIGPALDGGYYLIGMTTARPELMAEMAWSTPAVFPETLRRCAALGLSVKTLGVLSDCDTPPDLERWPDLAALARADRPGKSTVTLMIPALNEARALPATIANVAAMTPQPDEILLIDGGSEDETVGLAQAAGWRVLVSPQRGRGPQINFGVDQAKSDLVCILHADSLLPSDAIAHVRSVMTDPKLALATFLPIIRGEKTRWFTTAHNWWKTYYPAITHPHLFVRGVRLLFGDHAMFFRRADYLRIGGIPADATIMEEADLCIGFARIGKLKMTRKPVITSDRRIAAWGPFKANYIYLKVGLAWTFGMRHRLKDMYPDIR